MPKPPQDFLAGLRDLHETFTTKQAQVRFAERLRPSSVAVYLSHAASSGILTQVGTSTFRFAEPVQATSLPPGERGVIIAKLRAELTPTAFSELVVWSDQDLAPFLEDSLPDTFFVFEGGPRLMKATGRALRGDFRTISVRSYRQLVARLWEDVDHDDRTIAFLHTDSRVHGTMPSPYGFRVPTLGRILVAMLFMPSMLPEAANSLMRSPNFNLDDGIAATPSKKLAFCLGALVGTTVANDPEHPIRKDLVRLLPNNVPNTGQD